MDSTSWKTLSSDRKLQAARALTPPRFELLGVERCTLGETSNEVALFAFEGRRFALVPGGTVTLGYDRKHPYVPIAEQAEDLAPTQEELGFTLATLLDHHMSPLRTVTLAPFLMDVEASKQDAFDEEAIAQLLEGFRLPTTDEWEYACSGGATTLFRWGNHCPSDEISEHAKGFDLHQRRNAFGLVMNQCPTSCWRTSSRSC